MRSLGILTVSLFFLISVLPAGQAGGTPSIAPDWLEGMSWRSIGPAHFSGRVTDIAGVPGEPDLIYVAFASAGLFKSLNGGTTFDPIFESANTLSIGAIALDPRDPGVIYVGTGEGNPRNSISIGDGVYKSIDGGQSWSHLGLEATERFSRIVIGPGRPLIVYAAALGRAWGPNEDRGLYRSNDGGATWTRVLYVNETTGCSDVAVDPEDPDIVYAGMYDYLRQPWHFRSGGPGSGLYRSADGGETWTKLTDPALANGLPGRDVIGRIGVSICHSRPDTVYAMIESREPGELWRSDDRGLRWTLVSSDPRINNRPFYYTDVRADPADPDRVYALAGGLFHSTDGGRNFRPLAGYASVFGDHHALWIDPRNPRRMLNGNDGGLFLSNDQGAKWTFLNNMPSAQAYHVGVDMAEPYNVMGGFQDHEIWRGPNEKWNQVGVRGGDWVRLRYMADGMYALADPRDPNIVYYNGHFGDITRVDMRNQEERYIQPYPVGPTGGGGGMELFRFNWDSPVHMSPTNPDVVYYGGNVLFKTTDGGQSWKILSPDLTTDDKEKQKLSGGPITLDNTRAEAYCTIVSISESPLDPRVLWAGTDDGNLQLSRDGGATWTNLAPSIPGFPRQAWVTSIAASPHKKGGAYIAVDQHRLDDFAAYVFATDDFGKTWRAIAAGLRGWVHVVKEDPKAAGLLYAGTEFGVYVSLDDGRIWFDLRRGLPPLAVVDLVVHPRDNDLVIGTHARGFYILQDVTPLQDLARNGSSPPRLLPAIPAVRYTPASDTSTLGDNVFVAPNKPYGAMISYILPGGGEKARLEILDASGRVLRTLDGPARPGINRVVWDLGRDPFTLDGIPSDAPPRLRVERPRVLPGRYGLRLSAGGTTLSGSVTVRPDPRVRSGSEDLAVYGAAVERLVRMTVQVETALARIGSADERLSIMERGTAADRRKAAALRTTLDAVRNKIQPPSGDPENLNLRGRLSWLLRQVHGYSGRPTEAQEEWIGIFEGQVRDVLAELDAVVKSIR